jgi:SAM-dependent methyltransferase
MMPIENSNDGLSQFWEKTFSSRSWGRYPCEELIRFAARNFGAHPNKSELNILDIGCGPGASIWYFVREGYSVYGIDGSPTAIQLASERLKSENLPYEPPVVNLEVGNFVKLKYPDKLFDMVVDVESIYANTFENIEVVIGEIYRTLKVQGKFFGRMFSEGTTGVETGIEKEPRTFFDIKSGLLSGNEVAHLFNREDLIYLFSKFNSLKIDQITRTDNDGEDKVCEWIVSAVK